MKVKVSKMKKKYICVLLLVIGSAIFFLVILLLNNKSHRNLVDEVAVEKLLAAEFLNKLIEDISPNKSETNTLYLDKVIEISGMISSVNIEDSSLILNNDIYCSLSKNINESLLKTGSMAVVKGRYLGFDDLFLQAKFDHCVLIQ